MICTAQRKPSVHSSTQDAHRAESPSQALPTTGFGQSDKAVKALNAQDAARRLQLRYAVTPAVLNFDDAKQPPRPTSIQLRCACKIMPSAIRLATCCFSAHRYAYAIASAPSALAGRAEPRNLVRYAKVVRWSAEEWRRRATPPTCLRRSVGRHSHNLGTGPYTVMTQIAADALGMAVSKVLFELGDTGLRRHRHRGDRRRWPV